MIVAMMMLLTGSKLNQADCFELNLLDFILSPTYLSFNQRLHTHLERQQSDSLKGY